MKKKIITFIFTFCLIISCSFMLVACGETNNNPKTFSITINSNIQNGLVVANKTSATAGETITLTITPNQNYELEPGSLKYNGIIISDNQTFIMPNCNVVIVASFREIYREEHYISVGSYSNGTITANKNRAKYGETITLTVTPNPGFKLREHSLTCNNVEITDFSFIMPDEVAYINAVFDEIYVEKFNVNTEYCSNGYISVNLIKAPEGETITVNTYPDRGYELEIGSLKCDGVAIEGNTFIMPNHDVTITANFVKKNYPIYYHTDSLTTHSNPQTFKYDDFVDLSDAAKPGYLFVGWYLEDTFETKVDYIYEKTEPVHLYPKFEAAPFTNGLEFELNENLISYAVKAYSGTETEILIPQTYLNKEVTTIKANVFKNNTQITKLTMCDNIEIVEDNAFSGCTNLLTIKFSKKLTSVGANAFNQTKINTLTIPKTVTTIYESAFENCANLEEFNFETDCKIKTISDFAFKNCTKLTSVLIPQSVTTMGINPFAGCSGLETISVEEENTYYCSPDNCNAIICRRSSPYTLVTGCKNTVVPFITYTSSYNGSTITSYTKLCIGKYAFQNSKITELTMPGPTEKIDDFAFSGCSELTKILIPCELNYIGLKAFENCINLNKVYYFDSLDSWNKLAEGKNILSNSPATIECYNLTANFMSPTFITDATIKDEAPFINWPSLKRVYFKDATLNYDNAKLNFYGNEYPITPSMVEGFNSDPNEPSYFGRYIKINLTELNIRFSYKYEVYTEINYISKMVNEHTNALPKMQSVEKDVSDDPNYNDKILSIKIRTKDKYFSTTNLAYIQAPETEPVPKNTTWVVSNKNDPEKYLYYSHCSNGSSDNCYDYVTGVNYLFNLYTIINTIVSSDYELGNFVLENNSGKLTIENWLPTEYLDYMFIENEATGETTRKITSKTIFTYENVEDIPALPDLNWKQYANATPNGLPEIFASKDSVTMENVTLTYNNVVYSDLNIICPPALANYSSTGSSYNIVVSFNNDKYCTRFNIKIAN